jgi:hypothetical protein
MKGQRLVFACILALVVAAFAQAGTIRVPGNYPTIQQAIDVAQTGDTVLVYDGIYTGDGNKNLDFKGKKITVTSLNGPASTIIDCEGSGRAFYFHSGETPDSVLSGFTIRNGAPDVSPLPPDLIQIDLDSRTGEKRVSANARQDFDRPENDGDVAIEPEEIAEISVVVKNISKDTIRNVTATLKTDDSRIIGMIPIRTGTRITGWDTVNMATTGVSVEFSSIFGNSIRSLVFQFVKAKEDFMPLGDQVEFRLEFKSGTESVGSDEFDMKVGADITLDRVYVDDDLVPGSTPEDIDVRVRNVTGGNIDDVRVEIDPDTGRVDIDEDRQDLGLIPAGSTRQASFETTVDYGFSGHVLFTIKIRVGYNIVNVESYRHYFGMRTRYITYWITDDDNNNDIAEPDEQIELQIARWNLTAVEAENVEAVLDTSDSVIATMIRSLGDYDDISPDGVREARRDYEFTIDDETGFTGFPNFDTRGHTVEFTLDVEEDNDFMGQEILTMRIGGVIRYLPPVGFSGLMYSISDSVSLSSSNNGNGLPEPGETIEIEVTLTNISDYDVEDVEAELDSDDDVNIIDDEMDYDEIRDGREVSREYLVRIDDDFEGNIITFEVEIWGRPNGSRENLGTDIFTVPVWKNLETNTAQLAAQSLETSDPAVVITDSLAEDSYGGAIYCVNSSPTIQNNIITGNKASFSGGGIYCGNNSSPEIIGNVIVKNSAETIGGGVSSSGNASPIMINNTISGNSADTVGGGISCRNISSLKVLNTIIWANTPDGIFADSGSVADVTYSDIQGSWSGVGNINSNPLFLNVANNDYHLRSNSPCLGTGTMASNVPDRDMENNVRPNPVGSNPDMGAYESALPILFPTVTSVDPSSGVQGTTNQSIIVTGTNFVSGAKVSFSGSGITVSSTTYFGSTKLVARINISANAAPGKRDVIVTNPDGKIATGSDMFTVVVSEAVIVSVEVPQTVVKGLPFSADIRVEDVIDLAGFQLDVVFDPQALETIDVEEGEFLKTAGSTFWLGPDINNSAGTINSITAARTGSGGANGTGIIATITFVPLRTGETVIRPRNVRLLDSSSRLIPSTAREVTLNVSSAPPWDTNGDGITDITDLVIVGQYFGQTIPTPIIPNPDVNGDGKVDIFDLVEVGQHFGETHSPQAAPSRDIWRVDPEYLPVLNQMYNILESSLDSDPKFLKTKQVLQRLISNSKVSKTEAFQNYPNPFNPETWIPFQLSEGSDVEVRIYNSTGQLVKVLDLGFRDAGYYTSRDTSARWDGRDNNGEEVSSGVYFYTIRAGEYTATRKMLLVK